MGEIIKNSLLKSQRFIYNINLIHDDLNFDDKTMEEALVKLSEYKFKSNKD